MKIRMFAFYQKILAGLLMLLGYSACHSSTCGGEGDVPDEYGVPSARHMIKGKVVEAEKQGILPGIRVIALDDRDNPRDSVLTDAAGHFEVKIENASPGLDNYVVVKDIDGVANGSFQTDTVKVSFENAKYKNGERWYKGEATQEVTVEMKKNDEK